jgi:hypothetical protein
MHVTPFPIFLPGIIVKKTIQQKALYLLLQFTGWTVWDLWGISVTYTLAETGAHSARIVQRS